MVMPGTTKYIRSKFNKLKIQDRQTQHRTSTLFVWDIYLGFTEEAWNKVAMSHKHISTLFFYMSKGKLFSSFPIVS